MQIDQEAINALSEKEKKKILRKASLGFLIFGILLIAAGIALIILKKLIVLAIILIVLGAFSAFVYFAPANEKQQQRAFASYLSKEKVKAMKASGENVSKDDLDRVRFETDPVFYENVLRNAKSQADREYQKNVSKAESHLETLKTRRETELELANADRWDSGIHKKFAVNMTEGKIKINYNKVGLFTDIIGFDLHLETIKKTEGKSTGKTTPRASLGGAAVGAALGGAKGAVIGGIGMGKRSYKGVLTLTTTTICTHLGVYINLAGDLQEIVLLSSKTECDSKAYKNAAETALAIISKLQYVCKLPVPDHVPAPETNDTIIALDAEIVDAEKKLAAAKEDKPVYRLPEKYGGAEISAQELEKAMNHTAGT